MTDLPFWHPALPRRQIWRTALGFIIVLAFWLGATFAALLGGAQAFGLSTREIALGTTWPGAAVFFLSFLGFHLGLAVVLPVLHRRQYPSLFGPTHRPNLRQFGVGTVVTLAISAGLYALMGVEHLVLPEGVSPPITQARALVPWLIGLLPALALILIQTFAEEAVFRGYLLQQLRARFRSVAIWGIAPSLLFGLLHFDAQTYGLVNATAYVANATVMGTVAALVTLRTGNLAAAVGLHFGNNAALTLIGLKGTLSGFSLFTVEMDLAGGYTTYSILTQTLVVVLVFALWWHRFGRYRRIANGSLSH